MLQTEYLKKDDDVVVLSTDASAIAHDSSDIVVKDPCFDQQHAIIKYSPDEDCYILYDLNSAQGTYVNNARIQNSAVKLAPGDSIRFGHSGPTYELHVEHGIKRQYQLLPVQQQASWNSPMRIMVSPSNKRYVEKASTFPEISRSTKKSSCIQPHPPVQLRPRSAETFAQDETYLMGKSEKLDGNHTKIGEPKATNINGMLQERDRKIIHMGDEINRLAMYEQESKRKDSVIMGLREQLSHLQEKILSDYSPSTSQVLQKLHAVEKEIIQRRNEVNLLKDQLSTVNKVSSDSPTLTTKLTEREKRITDLNTDLAKTKKECAMGQGLIQSLQQEISAKESQYQRATTELSLLRKENKKKDVLVSSLSSKYNKLCEDRSKDEIIDSLKKELKETKLKCSMTEARINDQLKLLQSYKEEVTSLQAKIQNASQDSEVSLKQLEEFKQKYYQLQRSERMLKVDLEQNRSRLDRFRVRILNALYSCPGFQVPEDLMSIDDNEVCNKLKELVKTKMDLDEQNESLKQDLKRVEHSNKNFASQSESCSAVIRGILERVNRLGHRSVVLKTEQELLKSFFPSDKWFGWVYQQFADFLSSELSWNKPLDEVLNEAGYNSKTDDKNVALHVSDILNTLRNERASHQKTKNLCAALEEQHSQDLQNNIEKLLKENKEKLSFEIDAIRKEEEDRFNLEVNNLKKKEKEERLKLLEAEEKKLALATLQIEQLNTALDEKQQELDALKDELEQAYENNEKQKTKEKALCDGMAELKQKEEMGHQSAKQVLEQMKLEYEEDVKRYKEEIHQHSITIVSMEEKIQSLVGEKSSYASKLKEAMNALKKKQSDLAAQAQQHPIRADSTDEIKFLQAELLHKSHEIESLKATILGLRHDLSGSQARLSDLTGSLSESQKVELESNRSRCKELEIELNSVRQKLLKLSGLVDSQQDKIQALNSKLKSKEEAIKKIELEASERKKCIKQLEDQFETKQVARSEQKAIALKQDKITEELSSVGAHCRGECHEEIISRQCDALSELRARLRALEQVQPPFTSQEQALQQVVLLKKELAEIRAKQALEEDKNFKSQLSADEKEVNNENQLRSAVAQTSIERSAREQLEACLEYSEKSYHDVLNALSSILNLSSLAASGTMAHLPSDERDRLFVDRKKDLDKICSMVKSTLQQLDRKEQLLQGYESDLVKLREAEHFASNKSQRVDSLSSQLSEKMEEVEYLREALKQVHEQLEFEKRLNKAIKQRKTFHLENLDYRRLPPQPKSSYQTEADILKKRAKKVKQQNTLRRKNYEIGVLKNHVYGKEMELCSASASLVNKGPTSTPQRALDEDCL